MPRVNGASGNHGIGCAHVSCGYLLDHPLSRMMTHPARQGIKAALMLARLSIRDIVLIDRLDIDFNGGLSVLTGETGAGKSILLDAFALALGSRGDAALVRQGAEQGQVI